MFECTGERWITALHAGDSEGVLFANQGIRTLLMVGGEVAVFQAVAGEALVASGVVLFEAVEGEAEKTVHIHVIGGRPGGGADGIVADKFHVRQVDVLVVLSFVDDYREYLSHGVVDALDATVAGGMVRTRCNCSACLEACRRQVTAWSRSAAHYRIRGWQDTPKEVCTF